MRRHLLLLLVALIALVLLSWKGTSLMSQSTAFDASQWRAERGRTDERDGKRNSMIGALERDHLRTGMSREAVRALLGEPDAAPGAADEYDLGASPVGVTMESYLIEYDLQGRVARFGLRRK